MVKDEISELQTPDIIQQLAERKCLGEISGSAPVEAINIVNDHGTTESTCLVQGTFGSRAEFEKWLDAHSCDNHLLRLYAISQSHSWSELNICPQTLRSLVRRHNITQTMLRVVSCMHRKLRNVEEAYCPPLLYHKEETRLEYAYLIKYAQSAQGQLDQSWRIRQTAVYHQIDLSTGQSVIILFSPRTRSSMESRILEMLNDVRVFDKMSEIHSAIDDTILHTHFHQWEKYVRHFEDGLQQLTMGIIACRQMDKIVVRPSLLDEMQLIQEGFEPLCTIFESTLSAVKALQHIRNEIALGQSARVSTAILDEVQGFTISHMRNVQVLMMKHASSVQLFDKTMAFQHQGLVQSDSVTIRVITVITLVMLSFTVVGTIMSMPLFYLQENSENLVVSPSLWIYFAASVPLTLACVLYWQCAVRRRRRRDRRLRELEIV